MRFNNPEDIIALTPEWKGERFPDGRPKVPDSYLDELRKMTLEPAKRLGLEAVKGQLSVGADGDIVIFNPETIIDKADFAHLEAPVGIEYVLIGGQKAIAEGKKVNDRLGRFLPFEK